jgi:hypothetical protein
MKERHMAKVAAGRKQKPPPKKTDKKQSERFKETARELGANESAEDFEVQFRKIVPPKRQV